MSFAESFARRFAGGFASPFPGKRGGGGGGGGSQRPGNLTPPTISRAGQVLTCDPGDWTGNPTLSYRWLLNGTAVVGATSATWTPPASAWGALFGCEVVGVNAAGQSLPALAQEVYIGILDVTDPTDGAFGFHRLSGAYNGPAVIVRNSSNDPATQDKEIGFTATGALDAAAWLAHCGTGDGKIVQLYAQDGSGNHAIELVATQQANLVTAGVLETLGGKPAMRVNSSSYALTRHIVVPFAATMAIRLTGAVNNNQVLYGRGAASSNFNYFTGKGRFAPGDIALSSQPTLVDTDYIVSQDAIAGNTTQSIDGVETGSSAATTNMIITHLFYGYKSMTTTGLFGAMIFYSAARSATSRQLLERNLGAYYGITIP